MGCVLTIFQLILLVLEAYTRPSSNSVDPVRRIENIIKPPNDVRSYRGLILSNRMKVLLISDPRTETSAASMVVRVGALSDPRDTPGLAYLVGHMLMASSSKYPEAFGFENFLSAVGGVTDKPIIDEEEQNFYFAVNPQHLANALDQFAHFFIEPSLPYAAESILPGALQNVYSEYLHRGRTDAFRIEEVERSMSRKNHPYNHMILGDRIKLLTLENLGLQECAWALCDKVRYFHSVWYSSNIMTLVVLGKETLDQLEALVVPLFLQVQDKNAREIVYSHKHHPWGPEQLKRKIYVVPISNELHLLRLCFPVPEVRHLYNTAPEEYIGSAITREGPGSLHSLFRKRGTCTNLEYQYSSRAGIAFFDLTCDLTHQGVYQVDDIIYIIFQYIHMLSESGIQEWMFTERKLLQQAAFLGWRPKDEKPLSYVQYLATNMRHIAVENIMSFPFYRGTVQWERCEVENFLKFLRPDNLNVTIVSSAFVGLAHQTEEYYGTNYEVEVISDKLIKMWQTKNIVPGLRLPSPDVFMPENFDLYPIAKDEPKHPYKIHETSMFEIWFKQVNEFGVPELLIELELFSSTAHLGPFERTLWRVFHALVKSSMTEQWYTGEYSGFKWVNWKLRTTEYGIRINLFGYDDKLWLLLDKLLSYMTSFRPNKKNFNVAMNEYMETLVESMTQKHFFQTSWCTQYIQNQDAWSVDNILNVGKRLQYNDMIEFISKAFRRIFIRGLIIGNYTNQKAEKIINTLKKIFHSSNSMLPQELVLQPRCMEMASGSHFVYQVVNETRDVYAYSSYLQISDDIGSSKLKRFAGRLFYEIIKKPCDDLLKDKNKPSELMQCTFLNTTGVQAFVFAARTTKLQPRHVDTRVEKFLSSVSVQLRSMPNKELDSFKRNIITEDYVKPSSLTDIFATYWYEISNRYYNFDRAEIELNQLLFLTISDIQLFFKEMIDASSPRRRKLAIYVFPKDSKWTKEMPIRSVPPKVSVIQDVLALKISSILLPINYCPVDRFVSY